MSTEDSKSQEVPVKSLDAVKVAETPAARLVEEILRDRANGLELGQDIRNLADELYVSPWTVYRWLIGRANPRTAQMNALQQKATPAQNEPQTAAS